MRENAKVTRATYKLPKGEEDYVHYTIEKIAFNPKTGQKISRQEVIKTNPKMFDNVKRNLELQRASTMRRSLWRHPKRGCARK